MIHSKASSFNDNDDGRTGHDHNIEATRQSTTIRAVRFWTEQLKRAMLIRYGPVGNNVNVVRQLLHHTKQVVRQKDGMDHATYKFI